MAADRLEYDVVDVFTSRTFAGNPLAVVHGADQPSSRGGSPLNTAQLNAIAMEFNLSETTFPVALSDPDRDAGADYRVRIFTPGGEIPFAGHPTLGTAWVLHQRGEMASGPRVQACGTGLIGVDVPSEPEDPVELSATPRDMARELSDDEVAEVAALVGLTPDDVAGPTYAAGCGLSWLFLPVRPEVVSRSRPGTRSVSEAGVDLSDLKDPCDGVDVFSATVVDGVVEVNARVYVPGFGIPEDPATGSAAAGLGIVLVAAGLAGAAGQTSYRISQGVDMGRPSELLGRVEAEAGVATRCHVAGQVRHVASGTIAVPAH